MPEPAIVLELINYAFVLFFGIIVSLYLADINFSENKGQYVLTILVFSFAQLIFYLLMGNPCYTNAIRFSSIFR